jgi:pilus assembly protein CpaE
MNQSSTGKIKLLIVDDITETRENLRKLLYFETDIEIVGTAANGRDAIEQAKILRPDIILMDINMPDMDGITTSQEIGKVSPMSQVIMMSVQSEADYLRRSMLAGAVDFLTKPFSSEELTTSIHRVYEMGVSRRVSTPSPVASEPGTPTSSVHRKLRPLRGGKLLLVYSPKGGTGCSMVATNLAVALAKLTNQKVVLVDTSLQFGDVGVLLNLPGNPNVADATSKIDSLDMELMAAILSPHPSGIQALPAPSSPEMAEAVTAEELKATLSFLRAHYDYVVVDTWSYLDDTVLAAMDLADRLLLVVTPEIPSIKSAKQFFEVAEALTFTDDRIDLVLNKVIPRDGIRPEQLESSIRHEIRCQIPFDAKTVRQACNQGQPFVFAEPNNPLTEVVLDLARQELALLDPQPEPDAEEKPTPSPVGQKKQTGLFGRLKR